jgi:hypothetical protein
MKRQGKRADIGKGKNDGKKVKEIESNYREQGE